MKHGNQQSQHLTNAFDAVWADLTNLYRARLDKRPWYAAKLTEADVQRWSALMGAPREALYDQIAMRLARGFHTSEFDFTFCDAVINDVFGVILLAHESRPALFWQVFLAFDAGECIPKHNRDVDPVQLYTRPLIAKIIESIA